MKDDLITKDGKTIDITTAKTVGDVGELLKRQRIPIASIKPRDEEEKLLVDVLTIIALGRKVAELIRV